MYSTQKLKREIFSLFGEAGDYSTVGLPQAHECMYSAPRKDEERKKCRNCMFWVRTENCLLHPRDLKVSGSHICHHWIGGQLRQVWEDIGIDTPLMPETSGLELVKEGISCDNCSHYFWDGDETGLCESLVDTDNRPAKVHPKASCARWEQDKKEKNFIA